MSCSSLMLRTGLGRLFGSRLPSTSAAMLGGGVQQRRNVVHKEDLLLPDTYQQPWPYKEKGFYMYNMLMDTTQSHFHKNSKLIVVEGNIASGKSTLAAELAEELGFAHFPEFRLADIMVDRYGNDQRDFYHLFPECFRYPDLDMFYKNPFGFMTARMLDRIMESKWEQYANALAHILNTGQGVVMERSYHSDFVFANGMRAKNWIGPEFFKFYYYKRRLASNTLWFWPHLVIYLDVPVKKCLENIRARGNMNEINAVDETYLKTMEDSYKDSLREYKRHSKILVYDWSTPGSTDVVVEDIEKMELDFYEWHSGDIFEEWNGVSDEWHWSQWRQRYTMKAKSFIEAFGRAQHHEVGEMHQSPADQTHYIQVMKTQVLKSPYSHGYIVEKDGQMNWKQNWLELYTHLPEPWYDYFYREYHYALLSSYIDNTDPWANSYNPDYIHSEHH